MIMKKRKLRKGIALKLALLAALFVVATLGTAFGLNYLFNRPQEEEKNEEPGSLGVVKNIEFKIVAYLPRFFMLIFVKFYVFVYRILLYSMV